MKYIFSLLLIGFGLKVNCQIARLTISAQNNKRDTLKCAIIRNELLEKIDFIPIVLKSGKSRIDIDVQSLNNFAISDDGTYYYVRGIIEPRDSVTINYDGNDVKNTVEYAGKGSEKTILYNKIKASGVANEKYLNHEIKQCEPISKNAKRYLFAVLEGRLFREKYFNKPEEVSLQEVKFTKNLPYSFSSIYDVYQVLDRYYQVAKRKTGLGIKSWYALLNKTLPAGLRLPVITCFIRRDIKAENADAFSEIINSIPDSSIRKYLVEKRNGPKLKEGDMAPGFILKDTTGAALSMNFFKGKIIYMDFSFAGCIPCHILYEKTLEAREHFKNDVQVVFLNISIDGKDVWLNTIRRRKILGMHVFTDNMGRDHPIIKNYHIQGYPTTLLIDQNGKINKISPSENSKELIRQIEALKTKS